MDVWAEPVIEWHTGDDGRRQHTLIEQGELLAHWPPAPSDPFPTDCFRVGRDFWIWQSGLGGLCFRADHPACTAFAVHGADPAWFIHVVTRSWLPAVYQVWGRQVLHASAVVHVDDGRVVAFAGASGAGKSTLAYALARRPGWRPLCDDTLAFSCENGSVRLHPLQNRTRLRSATATYFGAAAGLTVEPIVWPDQPLTLDRIYFLDRDDLAPTVDVKLLRASEGYALLLGQAHAFTLKLAEHNQRLMRDYLTLAATAPVLRLKYRRAFEDLERVLDVVEAGRAAFQTSA